MLYPVPDPALDDASQQRDKMYIKEQDERMYNNGYEGHEDGSIEDRYDFFNNIKKLGFNINGGPLSNRTQTHLNVK